MTYLVRHVDDGATRAGQVPDLAERVRDGVLALDRVDRVEWIIRGRDVERRRWSLTTPLTDSLTNPLTTPLTDSLTRALTCAMSGLGNQR